VRGRERIILPLVTLLAELFFSQVEKEFLLLVVMGRMAFQTRQLLVLRILPHEILMTLAAAGTHNFTTGFAEAKNFRRVAVAIYVCRPRPMARLATSLRRMFTLQQLLMGRVFDGLVDVIVAGLAGVGSHVR
jgi:hypothetical protein